MENQDIDRFLYSRHYAASPAEYTSDFLTLAKILAPPDSQDKQEDEEKKSTGFNPGLIGPAKNPSDQEGDPEELDCDLSDEVGFFEEPKYDVVYKQEVKAEDLFLGFGNKNPSSASCDCLIVKIWLPNTQVGDIDLDVKPTILRCKTHKFKLALPLPHPVDPKRSQGAKFSDGLLTVSLKLNREYEFLNH